MSRPTHKQVTILLPSLLYDRLAAFASDCRIPLPGLVANIVERWDDAGARRLLRSLEVFPTQAGLDLPLESELKPATNVRSPRRALTARKPTTPNATHERSEKEDTES